MSLTALLLALTAAAPAHPGSAACTPPPPPCEALMEASLVFLADVLETGSADLIGAHPLPPQTVRLKVIERLKGIPNYQDELKLAYGSTPTV